MVTVAEKWIFYQLYILFYFIFVYVYPHSLCYPAANTFYFLYNINLYSMLKPNVYLKHFYLTYMML